MAGTNLEFPNGNIEGAGGAGPLVVGALPKSLDAAPSHPGGSHLAAPRRFPMVRSPRSWVVPPPLQVSQVHRGARRGRHGRRSSTRHAPSSRSATHGPSDAHNARLARRRLRGDVHRRGSALAKAAAAESDVDVGGGRPLAPYAVTFASTRMHLATGAGAIR